MMADWKEMISSLYGAGADLKNWFYDMSLLDQAQIPASVLSVGNLSMGGTGKTPVVEKVLSLALERNLKTAVVSRNYRARSRGIHQVDIRRADGGFFYGDEAFLLAQHFPKADVWTGPRKFLTAQKAMKHDNYKLVVVDDGFQHRALHRDFDLVLLDCTSQVSEEALVPKGRFREGYESLRRASAVALTKVNWATGHRVENLRSRVPNHLEIYEIEFRLNPRKAVEPGSRALSVCGIANPKVFEKTLHELSAHVFEVPEHMVFEDHHAYSEKDVMAILQRMRFLDCQQILTTEKDWVKLQAFPDLQDLLNPIQITTHFREEPQGLYAFLDRSLRH